MASVTYQTRETRGKATGLEWLTPGEKWDVATNHRGVSRNAELVFGREMNGENFISQTLLASFLFDCHVSEYWQTGFCYTYL